MFKLCLIIGSGKLPLEILKSYNKDEVFIIALKEAEISFQLLQGFQIEVMSVFKVGKIMKTIKSKGIKNICFVGGLKKPSFSSLKPDFTGFLLLLKLLKLKLKGDDAVLQTVIKFVENKGFSIQSATEVAPEILIHKGILTKSKPSKEDEKTYELGFEILEGISKFDIGQAIVIQEGVVIGVEAIEGTDALIERCGLLKYSSRNLPILVKSAKTNQTLKIDMPVIGLETIKNLIKHGFAGVVIKAGSSIIIEKEECIKMANENNLFIVGK
jgi:DUF1009 family protein